MYKRELFENMEALLKFLNDNKINERLIVAILPFQTNLCDGKSQLDREYELIYKDMSNRSCLI